MKSRTDLALAKSLTLLPISNQEITESRIQACGAKKAFVTKQLAKSYAKDRSRRLGKWLGAYRCQVCGLWHITSNVPFRKREDFKA